jgi:hypothetical protein
MTDTDKARLYDAMMLRADKLLNTISNPIGNPQREFLVFCSGSLTAVKTMLGPHSESMHSRRCAEVERMLELRLNRPELFSSVVDAD